MTDIWSQFQGSDEYFRFDDVGDSIAGEVVTVSIKEWGDGSSSPQLLLKLDNGSTSTVTASQVMLQRRLAEERPGAGDRVAIVYEGDGEAKPGRSPAKLFDVQVRKAGEVPVSTDYIGANEGDAPPKPAGGVSASDLL